MAQWKQVRTSAKELRAPPACWQIPGLDENQHTSIKFGNRLGHIKSFHCILCTLNTSLCLLPQLITRKTLCMLNVRFWALSLSTKPDGQTQARLQHCIPDITWRSSASKGHPIFTWRVAGIMHSHRHLISSRQVWKKQQWVNDPNHDSFIAH